MFITFICPKCGMSTKVELSKANRRIKELEDEIARYKVIDCNGDSGIEALKQMFGMDK